MELEEVRRQLESLGLRLCDSDSPDDRQHYGKLLAREILLASRATTKGLRNRIRAARSRRLGRRCDGR